MHTDIKVFNYRDRKIVIAGIGKLFYEAGFPISLTLFKLQEQGLELSIFHVASELLDRRWPPETVYSKIKEDIETYGEKRIVITQLLYDFIFGDIELQRLIIFKYLFNKSPLELNASERKEAHRYIQLVTQNKI